MPKSGSKPAGTSEPSTTSLTLLGRIRDNDRDAWELFVTLYSRLVYRWCRNRGLQQHDAADVMQDVFQQVAISIEQFRRSRASDGLRRWLATITRNKINDFYRRQGRQPPGRGGSTGMMILRQHLQPDAIDENHDSALDLTSRAQQVTERIFRGQRGMHLSRSFCAVGPSPMSLLTSISRQMLCG
ncbi:MAG: RNA polymerase sigma factor (sigma-70 family) [Pirellulaceae bacterium]